MFTVPHRPASLTPPIRLLPPPFSTLCSCPRSRYSTSPVCTFPLRGFAYAGISIWGALLPPHSLLHLPKLSSNATSSKKSWQNISVRFDHSFLFAWLVSPPEFPLLSCLVLWLFVSIFSPHRSESSLMAKTVCNLSCVPSTSHRIWL